MNRHLWNGIFLLGTRLAVVICSVVLVAFMAVIVWHGLGAIRLDFLLTASRNFGAEGGVFYQIVGSLLLILGAGLICFPLALGTAIFKSEYLTHIKMQRLCAVLIYGLNGVPSIVFGIFGLVFFGHVLNLGISWFVGSVILAMMILPTVVLASFQAINSVPTIYRESAYALGLNKWQVIVRVLIPQSIGGAVTGLLLGLARAVGETAPIMFVATAFSGVTLPGSLFEPVTALPTHILALAQQATDAQALQNGWGASLVLLCLVMSLGVFALLGRLRLKGAR